MTQQTPGDSPGRVRNPQNGRLSAAVIASLVGVGLLAIFVIQNTQRVTLDFLLWSFTWPLWLLALVMALIGALVWVGVGAVRRHRQRKARREDRPL